MTKVAWQQAWAQYCDFHPLSITAGNRQIRLVEIKPEVAFLDIQLHVHALEVAPPFEALSYSVLSSSEPVVEVHCDNFKMGLRVEIASFLENMREEELVQTESCRRLFWIDAISLDSFAYSEPNSSYINAIFAKATRTVVWLGEIPTMNLAILGHVIESTIRTLEDQVSFSDAEPAQTNVKVMPQHLRDFLNATKDISEPAWCMIDDLLDHRLFRR
jgi:hypothetical protein